MDKALALGREIVALQLLVSKQRKQIELDQSEKESLEVNLRFYKDQVAELEAKSRDIRNKLSQEQEKAQAVGVSIRIELEKAKQDNLMVEKDLIRQRELTE